ncbi:hypothetical protein D3C87_1766700 [compost metagenome]
MDAYELTVGELKQRLSVHSDDTKILFSGGLTFYRLKNWGDDEVVFEFNEAQAYLPDEFKKANPHVKVAFIDPGSADWDDEGKTGSIDVSVR